MYNMHEHEGIVVLKLRTIRLKYGVKRERRKKRTAQCYMIKIHELKFHEAFHRVGYRKARLCHDLPRVLGHLWQQLDLAKLVRVLAELA
jgi:hypothetical protein